MRRKTVTRIVVTIIFAAVGIWALLHRLRDPGPSLTPGEAEQLLGSDSSAVLLDVRTPEEYRGPLGHIRGSILVPVQDLEKRFAELDTLRARKIIVYCRTGNRSAKATALLISGGFSAFNMTGGILRWTEEHRPVETEHH